MSITGSLVGYENNNEVVNGCRGGSSNNSSNNKKKQQQQQRRSLQQQQQHHNSSNHSKSSSSAMGKHGPPSLNSSISNSVITTASSSLSQQQQQHQQQQQQLQQKYLNSKARKHAKYNNMHHPSHLDHNNYLHLNSLWSIWYGVLMTLFQGYLAVHGAYRFLGCSLIPWKIEPVAELNLQIVLSGVVFILLPLFFTSAVFKVGNLANDGIKLASGGSSKERRRCSMSPHDGLEEEARGGTLRALWTHGGPTAAFVHIVIAMCLLLPRLLLEARIIENGLLPRENIWQTELDFITVNRRNLVVLSVVTSPYQNISNVEDEDYYNDTMFTAIGSGSSINNNLLETNSKPDKQAGTKLRTRFFEVPDLINRENSVSSSSTDDDNAANSEELNSNAGTDNAGEQSNAENISGRISVEELDSNEYLGTRKSWRPQSTTTTTTSSSSSSATTTAASNRPLYNKNYDKTWDKLGTLGKENSLSGGRVVNTLQTTTTTGKGINMATDSATATTAVTSTTAKQTTPTTTTSTTTTTTAASTTTTTTSTSSSSSTTQATTTTTMADISTSSAAASPTSTSILQTLPTKTHHHHQQQQHQHHSHAGKSTRKHHAKHRQRAQNHHRRHHQTTSTTTSTSSGNTSSAGRSDEANSERAAEIQRAAKTIDFNRLDDLEMSNIFELNAGNPSSSSSSLSNRRDPASSFEELDYGRRAATQPKSTSTISTTTRDSNIHIVKPEMLPEIIPSTPVSSNSKIIEIKTKTKKVVKRMADEELQVEIEPEYLIGDLANNGSASVSNEYSAETVALDRAATNNKNSNNNNNNNLATSNIADSNGDGGLVRLDGFAGMLQIFFGIEKQIDVAVFAHPPSAEFVNLLFALLVWCVRYPAVFWTTTKSFGTVFSIQMIAAALDIIFSYVGVSNLYKLQVYSEAMPVQNPGLILNGVVTLALFLLSSVLMIASSMIMYLYGHGRLAAKMRDRSLITMKSSETWIYFAHCASLCYVLALAVVKAPLLNDLSATYKNNLHCPTFLSALISVVHLLLWIVIWLGLTAKRRWTFKLPPMDAYGIAKATTQPLLMQTSSRAGSIPSSGVGTGGGGGGSIDQKGVISNATSMDGGVEDIYWPKLTPSSPKLKVTFNEVTSTSDDVLLIGDHDHEQTDGKRNSPRGTALCFTSATGETDDGEYATLRAATAATVVGIGIGGGGGAGSGRGGSVGGCGGGQTPTGSINVKILHLSEYDELPPPPPPTSIGVAGIVGGAGGGYHSGGGNLTSGLSCIVDDYANCVGGVVGLSHGHGIGIGPGHGDDNTSEEGKLLACVRDDSVTYASTRDLEPPQASSLPPPPLPLPPPPMSSDDNCSTFSSPTTISSTIYTSTNTCRGRAPQAMPEIMQLSSSPEHLVSPLAPVTVTVHTNEAHIASSSTPRCLRRGDSGVPNEALTPRSDTTSTTESTTSPPERCGGGPPSESSSGVHSGEERDVEVVIRPRAACKPPPKPPQPAIQEEPYGRCTNMRMSSFVADPAAAGRNIAAGGVANNSATLPLQRSAAAEPKYDYSGHCSTMPLPAGCHSQQHQQQQAAAAAAAAANNSAYSSCSAQSMQVSSFKTQLYANSAVAMAGANAAKQQQQQLYQQQQQQQQTASSMHTTLPNGVRYSNPHFLRRMPHISKAAESPYGHLGLGAGHHTFSKLLHDPLQGNSMGGGLINTAIPEDRDSANYSMSSDQDCLYATANHLN